MEHVYDPPDGGEEPELGEAKSRKAGGQGSRSMEKDKRQKSQDESESMGNKLLNIRGTNSDNSCQTFRLQTSDGKTLTLPIANLHNSF
jgi:hypothetical protein